MPNFGAVLSNLAAPLANTVASHNFADTTERDKQRQIMLENLALQRQATLDANTKLLQDATIGNLNSKAEGQWGQAFQGEDENGPGMFQQHKLTGDVRRVRIGGPPSVAQPGAPVQSPTNFSIASPAMIEGLRQSMGLRPAAQHAPTRVANGTTGNIDLGLPDSAAPQQGTPAQPRPSGMVRPFVKPTAAPRPTTSDKLQARVSELTSQGVPLAKASEQARMEFGQAPPPVVQPQIISAQVPGGPPAFFRVPKDDGAATPIEGLEPKKGSTSALSGQTMQTLGRMGMSYNDLQQTIARMDAYENDSNNLKRLTPTQQTVGAVSEFHPNPEAKGIAGMAGNAAGTFFGARAQQSLAQNDPKYRQYLLDKQRVAMAFTELLPRPNQQLLQMEKGVSGADAGWTPDILQSIQTRRQGGLDVLKGILSGQGYIDANGTFVSLPQGGGRGRGGGSNQAGGLTTRAQQLWDAAVAKYGEARVLKEYGARP
jgi:hypothetical protein